jgi:hypothetical protein
MSRTKVVRDMKMTIGLPDRMTTLNLSGISAEAAITSIKPLPNLKSVLEITGCRGLALPLSLRDTRVMGNGDGLLRQRRHWNERDT